ncbi:MAG TPA: PIG-L family deacetylase, partial [Syntrophales bacterium]|jgi:LmbE family N-acetylglucosaminyl deacetylase|nr:PIG-L family deacetylase [Syntrophales bacterium]HON23054.1 PIG-L family deacetylase [Syntrophales bacterium]HOU76554.1 PIG-L family deacetylase [Syntrophales bacterium]HPC32423.1 PIG-L family deacetylase [Syntrophales bacterium]HQG35475.1 PIG-L family deacetylase [Syntrophales bacterium]
MNILAIGAHPDDIEFGCGGTLLKYIRNGHDVYLLVMTEGHRGGPARSRQGEQQRAARILKPKELIWGTYRDTELSPKMNEMVQDIESVLDRIQPQFTFVHYEEDTHQDHRALAKAAVSATRYVKNVLFYEGPTSQNFTPTVFVDVKDTLEEKIKLLLAHKSQVKKTNIEGLSIVDIARSTAVFRGIAGRVQYAEGFMPLRMFINIRIF